MSLLKSLTTKPNIADEKDTLGGGRQVLDSDLYTFKINLAYVTQSQGGAMALNLLLKTDDGKELRQSIYMTSGKDKGSKNTYTDKDGNEQYLPGFLQANSVALLTTGKEISELDTETKVIPLYDYTAKAEIPTKVEMIMDLVGKEIMAAVIKQTVDKTKKNEATNTYEATGETRDDNEIEKFFRASDRMTTAEIRAQATEASFADTWLEKWKGKVKNKAKGASGTAGAPGAAKAGAPGTAKPGKSLFG